MMVIITDLYQMLPIYNCPILMQEGGSVKKYRKERKGRFLASFDPRSIAIDLNVF